MTNMKYTLLEHIINEGRLEDTIKKYSDKLPEPVVRELSTQDPSGNNKYLDWLVRTVIQAPNEKADIITKIKCFHENVNRLSDNHVKAVYGEDKWRNPSADHLAVLERIRKTPKDINAYPSHHWIKPMCEYFEEQKPKNASRVKIFEDEKWLVVSPLTHQASCSYGAHSNWCVSTSNSSYFSQYTQNGILVFFIDKKGSNTKKSEANVYKFAVNIQYDYPNMDSWNWYSMEDQSVDARLMMNLVPRYLLDAAKKYFDEVLKALGLQSAIDEDELTKNSSIWVKNGNNYIIFPKYENWSQQSISNSVNYLTKFSAGNDITGTWLRYKEQGLPFAQLQIRNGRLPHLSYAHNVSWNHALNRRNNVTNTIPKSEVIQQMQGNYGFGGTLRLMTDEQKLKFYDDYVKMFNAAQITRNASVRTTELNVGDTIVFRPHGRTYGNGTPVTVTRVADKSLMLSNGKRIAKTNTSWKDKVLGVIRIVDDTPVAQNVQAETKWIRKRII